MEADLNEQAIKRALQLLWAGQPSEARAVITAECSRLEQEIRIRTARLKQLLDMLPHESDEQPTEAISPPLRGLGGAAIASRRESVLSAAREAVVREGKTIKIETVRQILDGRGVDLHVPMIRANTAVARILSFDKQFRHVARGLVEYVGDELPLHQEDEQPSTQ